MRLWHENLIPILPDKQILGQHRELCALRGRGWGRKHRIVNYVFEHSPYKLFQYHVLIMREMKNRGFDLDLQWIHPFYRGKSCEPYTDLKACEQTKPIYPEHDMGYLVECLNNLYKKKVKFKVGD